MTQLPRSSSVRMATFFKRLAPDRDIMLRRQSVTPAESGVSKQKVLERVMADDIKYLENIFNWHLSATTYAYARQRYDKLEYTAEWNAFSERFARKIARLNGNPSTPSS